MNIFRIFIVSLLIFTFNSLVICEEISVNTTRNNSAVISLDKFDVFEDAITLSGFSAGASMATQMHVAHSSLFHGVALFSQVFYRCGPSSLVEFGLRCSKLGLGIFPYDIRRSLMDARRYESQGLIDQLQNLNNQRIFLWTGSLDEYVPPEMAVQNVDFYKNFSSNSNNLINLSVLRAKHLFPTKNFGAECDQDASEYFYLGNCNYSGAYQSLQFLLRDKISLVYPPDNIRLAPLRAYNQSEFYPQGNITEVAMGTIGFVYIPRQCQQKRSNQRSPNSSQNNKCFLHLNFHGCNEWPQEVATRYILNSGFLPVAEANKIIMVFPLTTNVPQNMNGCWDFFSYTGTNFATKNGSQIKVARAIIERILRGKSSL